MGKSNYLPSHASLIVYFAYLELIYNDFCGPTPFTSFGGHNYHITFVDAYSKYTCLFLLKIKFEALKVSLHFKSMVEL
uniref:Retrovirus-related Pol polyprotein from transposon TNT 1-94 n=1 Tax=Cajanus cajan TaxID=3821 RepID=A0A151TGW6_CAJCA|nr:Retrovirus-related Pol polyprotein from transposon TNT 1-94 [Cajanus cajan]